jgi:hypothetical protein
MLLHLPEVRPAGDSRQVTEEDQYHRPTGKVGRGDVSAIGAHKDKFADTVADA